MLQLKGIRMNTLITPVPMTSLPARAEAPGFAARVGASLWKWLEEVGHARARRELRMLANQYEVNQPELAKELRAACERSY